MATSKGPDWSRMPIALSAAPDTNSPVFPERPIRPLPKRRLRSRLSEGEASSIDRPLEPSSSPSAFGSPNISRESTGQQKRQGDTYVTLRNPGFGRLTTPGAYESDDEREEDTYAGQRSSWSENMQRYPRVSATSSVDGESFENSNNKKKRKIPSNQHSNLPVDPNDSDPGYDPNWQTDGASPQYGVGKAASGGSNVRARHPISSGPKASKPPLTTSTNGLNNANVGIDPRSIVKDPQLQYGQENRRVPPSQQQQASGGQVNDFTFTAPSESSKQLHQATRAGAIQPPPLAHQTRSTTQGTQTTPTTSGAHTSPNAGPSGTSPSAANPAGTAHQDPNNPDTRRQPTTAEQLRRQAADRKRDQRYLNRRKPLSREDVHLCDYCLYEAIFLERPRALLRTYELKELKKRQEQENRRRLLEKAKAKSRKTRKQGRGQNQGQTSTQNAQKSPGAAGPAGSAAADDGTFDDGLYDGEGEYFDDEGEFAEVEGEGYYDDEEYPPPLDNAGSAAYEGARGEGR